MAPKKDKAPKNEAKKSGAKAAPPPSPAANPKPDPTLSWQNLDEIMVKYDLTHEEACAALMEVLGPDPNAKDRNVYHHIKQKYVTSYSSHS